MSRYLWNKWVNLLLAVVFTGLIFTGIIMEFVLPPGSGGLHRHGGTLSNRAVKSFLSMTRHEWGNIHFFLAIVFITGIIIHLYLNWKWIKNAYFQKRDISKST